MRRSILILWGLIFVLAPRIIYAQNVEYIASLYPPGWEWGVIVVDDYAYVSDGLLQVIDISDPYNPFLFGNYGSNGTPQGISVSGNYAYVISDYRPSQNDLKIINISDPADPALAATYVPPESGRDIFVAGDFAYISWGNLDPFAGGLQIIDISDPLHPVFAGSYDAHSGAYAVFVAGGYAYLTWVNTGIGFLGIIDVTDPHNPELISSLATPINPYGMFVNGNFAYLANGDSGLRIIDVSDPGNPSDAGNCDTQGWAMQVYISGDYAYIAELGSGIQVIDVSDPYNPLLAGSYNTPGEAREVYVEGDYIYVADLYSFLILQFNPQTAIEGKSNLPVRFALEQNYPNPFNRTTNIPFSITDKADISLQIFDLKGRFIEGIFEGAVDPGRHTIHWNAENIASGVYFYRLLAGNQTQTRRMLYLK